jgi:hypothetical protein
MADLIKALTGCVMPEKQKLKGPNNWNTWKSTFILYLKLLNLDTYFNDDTAYMGISESEKTQALLLIRQNLTEEPLSLIFDETDPFKALATLKSAYEGTGPVLRQNLYLEFHSIKFEHYNFLTGFISTFKTYLSKLLNVGAKIEDIDQKTVFIAALTNSYPVWAERQRSALRTATPPTLESLINDILDENRREIDTPMGNSYYTNNNPRNGNRNSNTRYNDKNRYNNDKNNGNRNTQGRNSGYNNRNNNQRNNSNNNGSQQKNNRNNNNSKKPRDFKQNKLYNEARNSKKSQNIEENDSSDENFYNMSAIEAPTLKTPTRESQVSALPRDWWLYDTGSTAHISNNKALFNELTYSNTLKPIKTGAGPVFPIAKGNITLQFWHPEAKIRNITLNNVLLIPEFPINIISGQKHYKSGGIISGDTLLDSKGRPFALLNHEKRGFFLNLAYKPEPDLALLNFNINNELSKITPATLEETTLEKSQENATEKPVHLNKLTRDDLTRQETPIPSNYSITQLWHNRLGHPSYDLLAKTAKITKGITDKSLKKNDLNCDNCITGKFTRQ